MDFFSKLKFLMERDRIKNLNVLAENSKIPYTTLKGFYTRGVENMRLPTIQKLCTFFNVTMDYLMRDEINDPEYGKTPDTYTFDEKELVESYRKLKPEHKGTIKGRIEVYLEEYAKEKAKVKDTRNESSDDFDIEEELEKYRQELEAEKRA